MTTKGHRNSLKPGYKLHWYRIIQILGQGGFGITYHARDLNLDRDVAIKEYLPVEMSVREGDYSVHPLSEAHGQQYTWGLDRFIVEARTLAKFDHPNIVRVYSVFEENNTGYMVMRYERGQSLQEKIDLEKTMGESDILKVIMPILNGLEMIHQAGFIHRDIKPDNIYLREDGSPVLIDFGSARQSLGEKTKTLTSLITPGYAPIEQYYSKSDEQGPWTDIYSLGATAYRAITGVGPMDALERSRTMLELQRDIFIYTNEICNGKFSEPFLKAIDHALKFRLKERPQSIKEWRHEFGFHTDRLEQNQREEAERIVTRLGTGPSPMPEQKKPEPAVRVKKSGPMRSATITLFLVLLACTAGYYFQERIIEGVLTAFMGLRHRDMPVKPATSATPVPVEATGSRAVETLEAGDKEISLNEDNLKRQQEEQERLTQLAQQRQEQEDQRIELEKQQIQQEKEKLAEEKLRLEAEKKQQEEARMRAEKQQSPEQQRKEQMQQAAAQKEKQNQEQEQEQEQEKKAVVTPKKVNQVARFLDSIVFPDVTTLHKGMSNICYLYSEDDPNACRRSIDQCREFAQDNQDLFKYCVSEYVDKLITLSKAKKDKPTQ